MSGLGRAGRGVVGAPATMEHRVRSEPLTARDADPPVAPALELRGISTVCLATLPGAIAKVRPPQVLTVPFERGMTVGPPGDAFRAAPDPQEAEGRNGLRLALQGEGLHAFDLDGGPNQPVGQLTDEDLVGRRGLLGAVAERDADASEQFVHAEGLGEVIVRAESEGLHDLASPLERAVDDGSKCRLLDVERRNADRFEPDDYSGLAHPRGRKHVHDHVRLDRRRRARRHCDVDHRRASVA